MQDEDAKQARLKYMMGIARQCDTFDEFRSVVDDFTGDYDIRDCVWNIVDIAEMPMETIATVGQENRGLASFLLDEVKKDFPEVACKPPFSQQGFLFLIRQEGFAGLSDFYAWARRREGWQ